MLSPLLDSHAPLDCVVVLLGTNDVLHSKVSLASEVARGIEVLVEIIQRSNSGPNQQVPSVLLVAPPRIGELSDDLKLVCSGDVSLARHLGLHIRRVAETRGVHFLDAATVCEPSIVDGVHLDEANLQRLGCAIAAALESALGPRPADQGTSHEHGA
jgi:lysophospholipase L1-like esterase